MKCQYHAVTSITMRRVSGGRRNHEVVPAQEMCGVQSSKNEKERNADIGRQVEVAYEKLLPRDVLAAQKP